MVDMSPVPAPSHRTQLFAVRLLTNWTLGEIANLFAGNELTTTVDALDDERWPVGSSERRDLAARHHAALDLSEPVVRVRLLRVYDEMLANMSDPSEFRRHLNRDGVEFEADGAIVAEMLRLPEAAATTRVDLSAAPWEAGTFRLFVSHTSENRERAARLRETLALWGVEAFVAHDAIEPTRDWKNVIEAALLTCDALCAVFTPDFHESLWCDQEIGFARARGILIVPLKAGADPHGFVREIQAVPTAGATAVTVTERLFEALAKSPTTANRMAPAIVRRYEKSTNFANTEASFLLMQRIPKSAWTPAMIEQVERAAVENMQVKHANLPGQRPIVDAVAELLRDVKGQASPSSVPDDEIPF